MEITLNGWKSLVIMENFNTDNKINNNWDQSGASEFFDAVANTKSVYEN